MNKTSVDNAIMQIIRYNKTFKSDWDRFVEESKNGTFLFKRDYMDYHSARFQDNSYLIFQNNSLIALFPACAEDNILYSHGGLTYGGLIMGNKATTETVLQIFELLKIEAVKQGFLTLIYKPVPHIYHRLPAEEDLYALFRNTCTLASRAVSSTVYQKDRLKFRDIRKSGIRKARKFGINIEESLDFECFWEILSENLQNKYERKPVHSLAEITSLASLFPENIKLFLAKKDNATLAGTVLFITPKVVHSQYITASPEGKEHGALDLIFDFLLNEKYADKEYFDFGISTEDGGRYLNGSLIYQKEGFGGRAICYDSYEIDLTK